MGPLMPRNFLGFTFTPSITLGLWAPAAENCALVVTTVKVSVCGRTLLQVKVLLRLYRATIKVLRFLPSTPPLAVGSFFPGWLLHLSLSFSTLLFFFSFYLFHTELLLEVMMTDGFIYAGAVAMRSDGTPGNTHAHTHVSLLSTTDTRAGNYICHLLESTTALIICDEL